MDVDAKGRKELASSFRETGNVDARGRKSFASTFCKTHIVDATAAEQHDNKKRSRSVERDLVFFGKSISLISLLAGSFRLLLFADAGLFVAFSLAKLGHDAVSCTGTLESLKSVFQGLTLFNCDLCHNGLTTFPVQIGTVLLYT